MFFEWNNATTFWTEYWIAVFSICIFLPQILNSEKLKKRVQDLLEKDLRNGIPYKPELILQSLFIQNLIMKTLGQGGILFFLIRHNWLLLVPLGLYTLTKNNEMLAINEARMRYAKGAMHEQRIVQAIKQAFEHRGAIISHRVKAWEEKDKTKDLDIFVRFPATKTNFAISVKSCTTSKVVFNEKIDCLCLRSGKRLSKLNDPDPITEILDNEWWLRRNNRNIFGGSSRDTQKPVRKVIVFAAPARLQEHNASLYAEVNGQKFLRVQRGKASIFILIEDEVVDFIECSLKEQEAQMLSKA